MQGLKSRTRRVRVVAAVGGFFFLLPWVGPGCSNHLGTTAASFLKHVREEPDPNIRFVAYGKLASPKCYDTEEQKEEAVKTLVDKLENGQEPVGTRALICHTLGELRKPSARKAIGKATNDIEPIIRIEACRALGKVGIDEDATILTRVMTVDTMEDCRIASIDGLLELKPKDPRIQQVLLVGMQHDDPAIRLSSLKALQKITGKDFGMEAVAWQKGLGLEPPGMSGSRSGSPALDHLDPQLQTAGMADAAPPAEASYPPKLGKLGPQYSIPKK